MGTLANQAKIGFWVQGPGALLLGPRVLSPEKFCDCICKIMQSSAFLEGKGRKMIRNGVHNAFLNTLQWGRRYHALQQLFSNGNVVLTRSPSK